MRTRHESCIQHSNKMQQRWQCSTTPGEISSGKSNSLRSSSSSRSSNKIDKGKSRNYLVTAALLLLATTAIAQEEISTSIIIETLSLAPSTTVTQTFTAPIPSSSSDSLSDSYTDPGLFTPILLNTTNYYRYLHSAPFVSYNTSLATTAQAYSTECVWQHNPQLPTLHLGENLARGYPNVTSAIDAWYNEVTQFDYDFDTQDPTGFTEQTGHFTQLVWKDTESVGCGWTDCSGVNGLQGVLFVCDYWPAGNVLGGEGVNGGEKGFFVENVLPERKGGDQGWEDVMGDAIRGIRNETGQGGGQGDQGNAATKMRGLGGLGMAGVVLVMSVLMGWT